MKTPLVCTLIALLSLVAVPSRAAEQKASPAPGGLLNLLKTETWEWYDNAAATKPTGEIQFLDNGKLQTTIHYLDNWTYIGGNKFKVTKIDGLYWVFDYRAAGRQAAATKAKGALEENKLLKVKR